MGLSSAPAASTRLCHHHIVYTGRNGKLTATRRGAAYRSVNFESAPQAKTVDVEEACEALSRVYVAAAIDPIGARRLNKRMNAVRLPLLTAGYLNFGADVSVCACDSFPTSATTMRHQRR